MIYFLLYNILLSLLFPFYILYYLLLSLKNFEYFKLLLQNCSVSYPCNNTKNNLQKTIWFHASSVGEVQALKPLITQLLSKKEYKIIISTMTITGQQHAKKVFPSTILTIYKPYDLDFLVNRCINKLKPHLFIVMETELWPNIIKNIKTKNIPLYLINARLSNKSVKAYNKIKPIIKSSLSAFDYIFTQSQKDTENFLNLGALKKNIHNAGNIKYDITPPLDLQKINTEIKKILDITENTRPIWIAASTHHNEEELLLQIHKKIQKIESTALLILAPRHPQRFNTVIQLCEKQNIQYITRSSKNICKLTTEIFILDNLGELTYFYHQARVAFIGGSLAPIGGHNPLEAIAASTPVIWGPHMFNFTEIKNLLLANNLGQEIDSVQNLNKLILQKLQEKTPKPLKNFHDFLKLHSGAINTISQKINQELCS